MAQVPSTVLTVEYVDETEDMQAALKQLDERMARLEKAIQAIQETHKQVAEVLNKQTRETGQFLASLNRRIDSLYLALAGGAAIGGPAAPELEGLEDLSFEVPEEFAGDEDHQQAWRIARVMTGDLDAYYSEQVREGVVYGNFFEILGGPIEQARSTYAERVPEPVRNAFDYLDLALKELIVTKRQEIEDEE